MELKSLQQNLQQYHVGFLSYADEENLDLSTRTTYISAVELSVTVQCNAR